jgi:hypothetical protein
MPSTCQEGGMFRRRCTKVVRVALAQINTTVGDVWENAEKAPIGVPRWSSHRPETFAPCR